MYGINIRNPQNFETHRVFAVAFSSHSRKWRRSCIFILQNVAVFQVYYYFRSQMIQRNDPCWCGSGKKYKKCHLFSDEKPPVEIPDTPPPVGAAKKVKSKYIKSPREIEGMKRAGVFNGELLDYIRPFIKPGISTEEIDRLVHEYTVNHGNVPACLGYRGYPKSVCTSINNVVCHGIPSKDEILKDGDIVNVDLTSIVDGYYGDSSETFFIGDVTDEIRHLVMVTAQALIRGLDAAKAGEPLNAIAKAIEPYVISERCSVVHQYTGHGIGKKFHEHFTVYHHIDHVDQYIC